MRHRHAVRGVSRGLPWTVVRPTLPAIVCGALLLVAGCGAKVAVDVASGGAGGSAGAGAGGNGVGGATGSSSTSSSTGTGFTCEFGCGGPIGLCGCAGQCSDGKMRAIGCGGAGNGGISCTCVVDGATVGTCSSPTLSCGLPGSCCGAVFGL